MPTRAQPHRLVRTPGVPHGLEDARPRAPAFLRPEEEQHRDRGGADGEQAEVPVAPEVRRPRRNGGSGDGDGQDQEGENPTPGAR